MSFSPINPDQVNLTARPNILTNTVRGIVGGPETSRPTLGQRFLSGLKLFGSIFAKIGGSLLKFFPFPGSQIASAGLYGLGDMAAKSYQNGLVKRMNEVAMDEAAARSNMMALAPGFGMFGTPNGVNTAPTMAPPPDKELAWGTVLNREAAASEQINSI